MLVRFQAYGSEMRVTPYSMARANVVGRRLRQARQLDGLAQDKLGLAIGLHQRASAARISRYETGVHEPPVAIARRMAQVLNVPLAFLYCDEDDLAMMLLKLYRVPLAHRKRMLLTLGVEWPGPDGR